MLADKIYIHQALAARLVLSEPEDDLSERERDVLRLIALGYTNQEIAKQLFLSVRTVEAHRRHILNKLRLETRADLVRYALEHRLVRSAERAARGAVARSGLRETTHPRSGYLRSQAAAGRASFSLWTRGTGASSQDSQSRCSAAHSSSACSWPCSRPCHPRRTRSR